MVVAVNTRLLLSGKMEGIGWFTHEILKRVVAARPEVQFHFFFDRPFDRQFIYASNVTGHVVRPPVRHPWLFDIWFNWMLPRKLKQVKADVFVSTDGFCSLRTQLPQLITVHDLNFMHHPEHMAPRYRSFLPKRTKQFIQCATAITTVSHYSALDIKTTFGVSKEVHVIYNAPADVFQPLEPTPVQNIRQRLTNGRPYFLFVSSIHPRKNLERILKAYEMSRKEHDHQMPLVVVGRRFWMNQALDQWIANMQFKEDVLFIGSLEQQELAEITGAAQALIYASLYEGFGIPIVEAMQCGVPVITSNCTSMPEVAGDAALLVDPYNIGEMAQAIGKLANDLELRTALISAGMEQAKKFNWNDSAKLFWEVVENMIEP